MTWGDDGASTMDCGAIRFLADCAEHGHLATLWILDNQIESQQRLGPKLTADVTSPNPLERATAAICLTELAREKTGLA